ncbi:MAG: RrF2 family transcriptional regulator [Clostridiales bacterium]|nr:RrF2 family transcriptional regulator [Clostridiales bacterium]
MMVSTKGRYALRIMLDLAQHAGEGYISLKEIAGRQDISMKYLEAIVSILNKAGFVQSMRGKDGGYQLSRTPSAYPVSEILALTEGGLAPVACMDCGQNACRRADVCLTLPMWKRLDALIDGYLKSVTLSDLLEGRV